MAIVIDDDNFLFLKYFHSQVFFGISRARSHPAFSLIQSFCQRRTGLHREKLHRYF